MLRFFETNEETFSGGNQYLSDPVQGAYMSDAAGQTLGGLNTGAFFQGYTEDDAIAFSQAQNLLRAEVKWYEVSAGLVITWTELKKDGITITDGGKKSDHGDALFRLTELLANRMDDFGESWARSMDLMVHQDGTQDAKQMPGLLSLITYTNPAAGSTEGLSRVTYTWWRNRAQLGILPNGDTQTLVRTIRREQRQLRKYMGKPNTFFSGSEFLDALDMELTAKGSYTVEGWSREGKTDIGMADISLRGVGKFEYDPTMDDLGLSKYCVELDSKKIKLRPMKGEKDKVVNPERPYNYMIFLKQMTWTGAMQARQLNCHEWFSVQ